MKEFLKSIQFHKKQTKIDFDSNNTLFDQNTVSTNNQNYITSSLISAVSSVLATLLYFKLVSSLINSYLNPPSKPDIIPTEILQYLPKGCKLSSTELEIMESITVPSVLNKDLNSIGGYDDVKKAIKDFVIDILTFGVVDTYISTKPTQGMLLYGMLFHVSLYD